VEQIRVKEVVKKEFLFVIGFEQMEEDPIVNQVMKLAEAIQQLQQRVTELELQIVPSTPQEVQDQREATTQSIVERINKLAMEYKQLSSHSVQTYEHLIEDLELKTLES
jgi:hypothetical protein